MTEVADRLKAKAELVPEEGFNLVGVDDFEEPGDELYLVAHFDTREEAEAELERRQSADADEILYLYGQDDESEAGGGDMGGEGSQGEGGGGGGSLSASKKDKKPGKDEAPKYSTKKKGAGKDGADDYAYESDDERDPESRFVVSGETKEGAHFERPQDSEHFSSFGQWRGARKKGLEGKTIPKQLVEGAVKHAERHHFDSPTHHQAYDDYQAHQEGSDGVMAPPSHKKKPGDDKKKDKGKKKDAIDMVGKMAVGELDLTEHPGLLDRTTPPDLQAEEVDWLSHDRGGMEVGPVGQSARDFERDYLAHYDALQRGGDAIDALAPLAKGGQRGGKYLSRKRVGDHWVYSYRGARTHSEKATPEEIKRENRSPAERAAARNKQAQELADEARKMPTLDSDTEVERRARGIESLKGKYTDKAGKHVEHPVSEKQRRWAFAAEEKGELPKGTAMKWSRRAARKSLRVDADGRATLVKGGLYEFNLQNQKGALSVPDNMLYDYLCAFVEEAVEVEQREPQHRGAVTADAIAMCVLHELVQFIPKNENLRRAAVKFKVTEALVAQIIERKGMLRPPAATDLGSMSAMGAYGIAGPTNEVMLASSRAPWVQADPTAPRSLQLSEGPRMVSFDDGPREGQNALSPQFRLSYEDENVSHYDAACLIHGELHKNQIGHQPFVKCSCPQ